MPLSVDKLQRWGMNTPLSIDKLQRWGMDTPFRKHKNIEAVFSRENLDADIQEVSLERH